MMKNPMTCFFVRTFDFFFFFKSIKVDEVEVEKLNESRVVGIYEIRVIISAEEEEEDKESDDMFSSSLSNFRFFFS